MGTPAVTFTFQNGGPSTDTQINQNFTDLINALTDGTADITNSTLSLASTLTANGNVVLGNGAVDSITINGELISNILPVDETYYFGETAKGWAALHLADSNEYLSIIPSAAATASWTLTLPPAVTYSGAGLRTGGSSVETWVGFLGTTSVKTSSYPVTDDDGIDVLLVNASGGAVTITLPTAADNAGRNITIKKTDISANFVLIDGEGAETIDGLAIVELSKQNSTVRVVCDGTEWHRIGHRQRYAVEFTSDGSWTAPKGVTSVVVEGYGGGGGGGDGDGLEGGGGGAGSLLMRYRLPVTGGTTYTVTVGAGGAQEATGAASAFGTLRFRGGNGGVSGGGFARYGPIKSDFYHYGGAGAGAGAAALNANYTGGAGSNASGGGAGPGGNGGAGATGAGLSGTAAAANTGGGGGGGGETGGSLGAAGGSGKVTVYWTE